MVENNRDADRTESFVPLIKGTKVGHYTIIEKIGAGGMGEVYLAEDTKLKRQVALKFLPANMCADEDCRNRFKREAQATAKLNHPNIVTIFEVSEFKGRPFFAMEHVEGDSLADKIKEKKISINEAIDITKRICEGLHEAHEAGIVHRDIKPGNIILDKKNRPRLLDFGLATILDAEKLTKTGSTLGTVGYMSPEQINGEISNATSDLFSVGVILYEMITGRRPFQAEYDAAIMNAILHDTPEPLSRYKSDVSEQLQQIVTKLIEKNQSYRYQTAAGVLSDLKRLSSTTKQTAKPKDNWNRYVVPSALVILVTIFLIWKFGFQDQTLRHVDEKKIMLAVLPFENLGDSEDDYFADGITREISSRLASVPDFGVIAHASAATYKNTDKSLDQIAEELGVAYILDGSIQWDRSGDSDLVRVAPQLIKASKQTQVWAGNYERTLTRVFQVQADIANDMARALGLTLTPTQSAVSSSIEQIDPVAYSYYLKGMQYFSWIDLSNQRLELAVRMFEKAAELESDYAEAHARLSIAHTALYRLLIDHTPQRLAAARSSVEKARQVGPELLETQLALGWFYYYGLEKYDSAQAAFIQVLKMDTDNSEANSGLARVKRRLGLYDEAAKILQKAIRFDPMQPVYYREIAFTLTWNHRQAEALQYLDKAIDLAPDNFVAHGGKAYMTFHVTGSPRQAREVLYEALEILPRWASLTFAEAEFYFMERMYDSALALLTSPDRVRNDYTLEKGPDSSSYYLLKGDIFLKIGESELARHCFDSARIFLEAIPFDSTGHYAGVQSQLALAYARLGYPEKAVSAAMTGIRLLEHDQMALSIPVYGLAIVHMIIGQPEKAIDELETLLSCPSWYSTNWMKINPLFDPLRNHPRFQALIEKYEKEYGI